eukprot:403370165
MHIFESLLQQAIGIQSLAQHKFQNIPLISQHSKSFRELCTSLISQNKYLVENCHSNQIDSAKATNGGSMIAYMTQTPTNHKDLSDSKNNQITGANMSSILKQSFRASNISDQQQTYGTTSELRKAEQKLEEYRVVLKNLESELKHTKQKEQQFSSEIDRLRNDNMSLNEQLMEALNRANAKARDNSSNRKDRLSTSMKQQQTLEIQELLKLHEESEDILKKKMTLIQILEQQLKDQSGDMQLLESTIMELKQETRVKDDQLYMLNRELQRQDAFNNELQHQNFDIQLSIANDKTNKLSMSSRNGQPDQHRASSQLTKSFVNQFELQRNAIVQSLILEDIFRQSQNQTSEERLLIERLDDQQLVYSKLEEKFRTIIREREIIEEAITGIVEFEAICEGKLASLMGCVTEYQGQLKDRDSQQQNHINSLYQFLQSALKEALIIFEHHQISDSSQSDQPQNPLAKLRDLQMNLGVQTMGTTFDTLINIIFEKIKSQTTLLKSSKDDLNKLKYDWERKNSEVFVEFQDQIADLKVVINRQNIEIEELTVKLVTTENDKSWEQLRDKLLQEKSQMQNQLLTSDSQNAQMSQKLRIIEDDQKHVLNALQTLTSTNLKLKSHTFQDKSKETLFGLIKSQMLEMIDQIRIFCEQLRSDNDILNRQISKLTDQVRNLEDARDSNRHMSNELKNEIESLKNQLKQTLISKEYAQNDEKKQQVYLEQILRNLQDLKYQNETTMHVSPHRSHLIPHYQYISENPSMNNSSFPKRDHSQNNSLTPQNNLNLIEEQLSEGEGHEIPEKDQNNHEEKQSVKQQSANNSKRGSLTPKYTAAVDYSQYLHNKSVEEASLNESKESRNTITQHKKSNPLQEMSFNNLLNTQKKTHHNKENLDSLIQKFRLENQAFSSRVQNLKSRIDTAYDKFANQQQTKSSNKVSEYRSKRQSKQNEEFTQVKKNNTVNLSKRFMGSMQDSDEENQNTHNLHRRSVNSSTHQYPQVQVEVDGDHYDENEYGQLNPRKTKKLSRVVAERESANTVMMMHDQNSHQNIFGSASRRTSEPDNNNNSGYYQRTSGNPRRQNTLNSSVDNNSLMKQRAYLTASDEEGEMSDDLMGGMTLGRGSNKNNNSQQMSQNNQRVKQQYNVINTSANNNDQDLSRSSYNTQSNSRKPQQTATATSTTVTVSKQQQQKTTKRLLEKFQMYNAQHKEGARH